MIFRNMPKRITIVMDDDNVKKLRSLQAKMIKESEGSVSLSRVINEILAKSM